MKTIETIKEIMGWQNRGKDAYVYILTESGTEAVVWVGGQVELDFAHGKIKAFVKRKPLLDMKG